MQRVIRESLRETRAWGWSENDTLYAASGAALKYAESQGQKSTPELRAAIMAAVREEMNS